MSKKKEKVFVGLSGGVDSAVSAALLQQEGYDVTGLFVRIALPGYPCSAGEDRREALRVAAHLQIPFVDIDLSRQYEEKIFRLSMDAYRRGETPNPDALCNREIKFGLMYDFAMASDADFLATGHYAQIAFGDRRTMRNKRGMTRNPDETVALLAGEDPEKDQSYFLWAVPEERLHKTIFPIGRLHKKGVRALAKKFDLPNAERRDSQGLCFLGGVSMEEALVKELAPVPGAVCSASGEQVGTHRGAVLYTIGERHGFSVYAHDASAEPLYVTAKDIDRNTITVAPHPEKGATFFSEKKVAPFSTTRLRESNWIGTVSDGDYHARFRYRQKLIPATLSRTDGQTIVELQTLEPVPIGQSLVLYDGKRCLGGGIIAATSY